jgi:tetratricopeptide (TPR) repeat protein
MPKSSPLPNLTFTDHRIRIIKAAAQGDFVEARLRASRKYDEAGDPARAVAEAQAAIELEPRNLAARLQLGQIFLSHNTPAPAVEIFSDALAIAPDSVVAHLGRGLALRDMQRFDEAEKELTFCLARDPKLGIALDALGGIYLQISQAEKLMKVARQYIETNPSDHRGYYYLAAAAEHDKQEGVDVSSLLRHALKLNPNFAASHALLGKVLTQQDRLDEGVTELERAVQLRPDYAPAHLYLGNAYRKVGRTADATREFQTLRELNEKQRSQPSLTYHRGQEHH